MRATGSFDVKLSPLEAYAQGESATLGRMSLDKRYHGPLAAISKGEMLSAMTAVNGSAAYVAIEHVSGSLGGRSGTFVLQHSASMSRGAPQLSIIVVPDSGTGQLTGLTGKMNVNIVEKNHFYEFEYELPDNQ